MSDRVFTGILDSATLQNAVDALRPHARYAIVERVDAIDFPLPTQETVDVKIWHKGRIFDPTFELRWERMGQDFRAVLSSEQELASVFGLQLKSLEAESKTREYCCWNETNRRLGRTLNYRCVPGKGGVLKLSVREYRDERSRLVFWRYEAMKREGGQP